MHSHLPVSLVSCVVVATLVSASLVVHTTTHTTTEPTTTVLEPKGSVSGFLHSPMIGAQQLRSFVIRNKYIDKVLRCDVPNHKPMKAATLRT